jgi:hypothetical protein
MLLGIWLVLCQWVTSLNPHGLGTLVYANGFTRDSIHECEEASLVFPCKVFLGNKRVTIVCLVRLGTSKHLARIAIKSSLRLYVTVTASKRKETSNKYLKRRLPSLSGCGLLVKMGVAMKKTQVQTLPGIQP